MSWCKCYTATYRHGIGESLNQHAFIKYVVSSCQGVSKCDICNILRIDPCSSLSLSTKIQSRKVNSDDHAYVQTFTATCLDFRGPWHCEHKVIDYTRFIYNNWTGFSFALTLCWDQKGSAETRCHTIYVVLCIMQVIVCSCLFSVSVVNLT